MSIISDARLRLLEARVAELKRQVATPTAPGPGSGSAGGAPKAKRKSAPKTRQQSRKRP